MEAIMVGETKPVTKRFHKDCYIEYLKDQKFKREEDVKKDELNETLKSIYGVSEIPNSAWSMLQKLRNGDAVFGGRQKLTKRYKEGYDYLLIRDTFEFCSETINYYNGTKNFGGFMGAFKYAMSIIIDKVYVVEQRNNTRDKQEMMINMHLEKAEADEMDYESSYKANKKQRVDISEFLD